MKKTDVLGRDFAVFTLKKATRYKILASLLVSLIVMTIVWWNLEPDPISGDDPKLYRTLLQYAMFGTFLAFGKAAYNLFLDMEYLHFTEDKFSYGDEGSEVSDYWINVVDIKAYEVLKGNIPYPEVGLKLFMADKSVHIFDPKKVDFSKVDALAIALEFWNKRKKA